MQIHLDPVGGVAGDMFVAAILDAYPELESGLREAVDGLSLPAKTNCRIESVTDGVLAGSRFIVEIKDQRSAGLAVPAQEWQKFNSDRHAHWSDIRELIQRANLSTATKRHATRIFELLAEAEARIHAIPVEQVSFHEIGAIDSIVDIIGAAFLIDSLQAENWTISSLPLGSGQIETAHGRLPIPAPATTLLLESFPVFDDGIPGERVTPTGAAIVRYLCQRNDLTLRQGIIVRSGFGLGTKKLLGISNGLRALFLQETSKPSRDHRELFIAEFEVDDQSAEELSIGLEHIRNDPAVFDVIQMPAIGKKGRQTSHIEVLGNPAKQEHVIALCFRETTTIGLRFRTTEAIALARQVESVQVGDRKVRVKVVERPGIGPTAKIEAADLSPVEEGQQARAELKSRAETLALDRKHESNGSMDGTLNPQRRDE
jgi:pyridinium-3,5-bisthiocarboxylic acid mononucleotide nickel chelatase